MFCTHFALYYEGISSPLVVKSIKWGKESSDCVNQWGSWWW